MTTFLLVVQVLAERVYRFSTRWMVALGLLWLGFLALISSMYALLVALWPV